MSKDTIYRQDAIDMLCSKCTVDKPETCSTIQKGDNWCEEVHTLLNVPSAQSRWIPVTERLPGEDDYKPCCGYEDGAVWWFNDMGLMGLGWYYPSTGKWAYYDESDRCDKCVGNVVAWMPLPEPYREEEKHD